MTLKLYYLLLILFTPLFSIGQSAIRGVITDYDKDPIDSVKVRIINLNIEVWSDEKGMYEIEGLHVGMYDLQIIPPKKYVKKMLTNIQITKYNDTSLHIMLESY